MSTDFRAELQRLVEAYDEHGGKWPDHHEQALLQAVENARATLARWGTPANQPVPVSERLPEDCDSEGMCWQWQPDINGHYPLGAWVLQHRDWLSDPDGDATHWLPANALPLPQADGI